MTSFSNYDFTGVHSISATRGENSNRELQPWQDKRAWNRNKAEILDSINGGFVKAQIEEKDGRILAPGTERNLHANIIDLGTRESNTIMSKPRDEICEATEIDTEKSTERSKESTMLEAEAFGPLRKERIHSSAKTDIYVDGSFRANRGNIDYGGIGVFFGEDDRRNISESLVLHAIGANTFEFLAILRALQCSKDCSHVTIWSDSQTAVGALQTASDERQSEDRTKPFPKSHKHWDLEVQCLDIIQWRKLSGYTTHIQWVKGHRGNPGNEAADRLAGKASKRFVPSAAQVMEIDDCHSNPVLLRTQTQKDEYKKHNVSETRPPSTSTSTDETRSIIALLGKQVTNAITAAESMKHESDKLEARIAEARGIMNVSEHQERVLHTSEMGEEQEDLDSHRSCGVETSERVRSEEHDLETREYGSALAYSDVPFATNQSKRHWNECEGQNWLTPSIAEERRHTITVEDAEEVESWANAVGNVLNPTYATSIVPLGSRGHSFHDRELSAFAEALASL